MRTLIFHLNDSKNLRGGERQTLYLAEELSKLKYENYIVCRKNSPIEEEAIKRQIKTITLPYLFEWDIFSAYKLAKKIKKIAKNNDIPILHSHTGHTASLSLLTSLFIKAIRIVHRRVEFNILNNPLSRIKYENANFIIAVANKIKEKLVEQGFNEEKIIVIPSTIKVEYFMKKNINKKDFFSKFNIPENSIVAGTLAAMTEEKDPFNLIKAAEIVLKKFPEIHFLWGGEGHLEKSSIELVKKLNLEKNFHIIGYCKDNISFLKSLDIFIFPSSEEGIGSVLIEAMACGLPLIGTNAGGIPELIEDGYNGLIVPKKNPEKLAEAILKLAQNKELREKFGKNSLTKSQNYTTEKMAKETLKVYEKAIENFKSN